MTTDHQMATAYTAQQQVIVALRGIDEPDLAGRLERCMTRPARRRWLAVHLPICCMCLVPTTGDPFMVELHASMDGGSNYVEPCHHPTRFVG